MRRTEKFAKVWDSFFICWTKNNDQNKIHKQILECM